MLTRHHQKYVNRALVDTCIDKTQKILDEILAHPPADEHAVRPQLLREIAHVLPQAKTLRGEKDLATINNYFQGLVRYSILDSWRCQSEIENSLAQHLLQLADVYKKWYGKYP